MKKAVTIILFLALFYPCSFAKIIWKNIDKGIYLKVQSVKNEKDGTITGWFKTYATKDHELYDINGIEVIYTIDKIQAFCDLKTIDFLYTKYYGKNNKLIMQEPNISRVMPSTYNAYVDGEIYYNALCRQK